MNDFRFDAQEDTIHKLRGGAYWRERTAASHPDDKRNARAAIKLHELAETAQIPDAAWKLLEPHYKPSSHRWTNAVSTAIRDVAFRTHPQTFGDFLNHLVANLNKPARQ